MATAPPTPSAPKTAPTDSDLDYQNIRAYEHRVAHAQRATRAGRNAKYAAVLAAVLALFTGTAWTTDLGGGTGFFSSTTVQVVAAIAAFAAALVASLTTTLGWNDAQQAHATAAQSWATVMLDIKKAKRAPTNQELLELLEQDTVAAQQADAVADLDAGDFEKARQWILAATAGRQKEIKALNKLKLSAGA